MRTRGRDRSGAEDLLLVPRETQCFFCRERLLICETRERHVQRLTTLVRIIGKGKRCASRSCQHGALRYRSPEVGRVVLKAHEFGRDIVLWSGDQHVREGVSIPRVHRRLVGEYGVPICERSVGNLVDDYLALCHCVAGESGRVRQRLKRQGAIVLCVDGVHFDETSPVLYVQRDAISGEVLYAERRLAQGQDDLVPMLRRSADLAAEIGVPIIGIASDKERSLVPAIAEVFPNVPHQFCQTHFLKNVAEPLKEDDQELARVAKETVLALRKVERTIAQTFPTAAVSAGVVAAQPATTVGGTAETDSSQSDAAIQEATIAATFALAGTTVGMVSGRPITDPPGLKRIRRLEQVRAAVEQAARKKGAPKNGWPLLTKLQDAFAPLDSVRPVANRLERHLQIVGDVARILKTGRLRPQSDAGGPPGAQGRAARGETPEAPLPELSRPPASQVKRVLRRYLNRLQDQAPRRGRGAHTGHFVDHLVKLANSYWPGLFHTYDHPEIPSTTNGIEGFFGSSKRSLRSTTGRSSTAGGKMQSSGEFAIAAQALMGTMPKAELDEQLNAVSDADFAASKTQLLGIQEPARRRRGVQRRPKALLERTLDAWLGQSSARGP
jgi:hypothetical protein